MLSFLEGLLQKEKAGSEAHKEEDGADEVRQREWEFLENDTPAEGCGIALCWMHECATKSGTQDASYRPDQWHDTERPRLQFSLRDHFCHTSSHYTHVPI